MQQLDKCRTQCLIIGGITAGIFGFDGLQGMIFYVFLVGFISLMIAVRLGFNGKPYFMNLSQAATTGLFNNMLTFMLFWVMIHNFVYVL
jgi:ER membrane protein complex subunit 6